MTQTATAQRLDPIERTQWSAPPPRLPAWMGVRGFVDIHSHTLPGLDDGPKNEESARLLAETAYAGGTLAIIATPHFSMRYPFDPALVERALKDLERKLPEGLKLFSGSEIEVNDESLRVFFAAPRRYTLNASRYALIELMQNSFPTSMERLLGRFEETGTTPILAHPERYPRLLTQRGRLLDWVRRGCLLQITADSLSGRMGRRARTAAFEMLEEGLVSFVASDAHDALKRGPALAEAYRTVAELAGVAAAARLFTYNPLSVLRDETIAD